MAGRGKSYAEDVVDQCDELLSNGDDGNLIGEEIGWVERYDGGKQWKGFTRHGALPFRRSRPHAARDALREWRIRSLR